jgi:2-isopropylmalate synthase
LLAPPAEPQVLRRHDPRRVKVFDTTLRDGEQSPGCSMTSEEKLQIAKQLHKLGVDIIEAGFPIASQDDFKAVKQIADTVGQEENPPIICGLARATPQDINTCADAVKGAKFPRIHTFIASSDIHMEHKLRKTRAEVLEITREMVTLARSHVEDVEFSAEDALRSDWAFLAELYSVAIEAGATTLNVPDTVGFTTPTEFRELIKYLRTHVKGVEGVTLSVHGHNDLGMAVANFLGAIEGGARQVEVTINGIGERAGNAAMEEVVMALHVRKQYYNPMFGRDPSDQDALTNINMKEIYRSSKLLTSMTGMFVQPNKAIVGANAFAHESGIHQDGMLKNKLTYEIIAPETIGYFRGEGDVGVVMGKHSGRHALKSKLKQLGFPLEGDELNEMFDRFKLVAEQKTGGVGDDEIIALVTSGAGQGDDTAVTWKLDEVQVVCGTMGLPTATVKMTGPDAVTRINSAVGTGPVDAAYKAIDGLCRVKVDLVEYTVNAVVEGIESLAQTRVSIRAKSDQTMPGAMMKANVQTGNVEARTFMATGADSDIVVSSARAYVAALNRMISFMRSNAETVAAEAVIDIVAEEEEKKAAAA